MSLANFEIIKLNSIDSTNNYAMKLIDADKAGHGLVVTAETQTGGRGQRGRTWLDTPGQSLLMSLIVCPGFPLQQQFIFNAAVTVAIANVLQKLDPMGKVQIKWPNDIIITDKKAGGILIENVIRGNNWSYSVIGLGINVFQQSFPDSLPYATSLQIGLGTTSPLPTLAAAIRDGVLDALQDPPNETKHMNDYNAKLYKKGETQLFSNNDGRWTATLFGAAADGTLRVRLSDGTIVNYTHGQVVWEYGNE